MGDRVLQLEARLKEAEDRIAKLEKYIERLEQRRKGVTAADLLRERRQEAERRSQKEKIEQLRVGKGRGGSDEG